MRSNPSHTHPCMWEGLIDCLIGWATIGVYTLFVSDTASSSHTAEIWTPVPTRRVFTVDDNPNTPTRPFGNLCGCITPLAGMITTFRVLACYIRCHRILSCWRTYRTKQNNAECKVPLAIFFYYTIFKYFCKYYLRNAVFTKHVVEFQNRHSYYGRTARKQT